MSMRGCVKIEIRILSHHFKSDISYTYGILRSKLHDNSLGAAALGRSTPDPHILCSGRAQVLHRLAHRTGYVGVVFATVRHLPDYREETPHALRAENTPWGCPQSPALET